MANLELPFGIKVLNPVPVDAKYLNEGIPYTSILEVNTLLGAGIRHIGLTVNINDVEYWYDGGILDGDLVVKTGGTGGAFEVIDEGNGDGIVKTGRVAANYGNIGENATDLSHSDSVSTTRGATGQYSHAEGLNTTASGYGAHAEGYKTKALGDRSHAEGNNTTASGYASHAEGNFTTASGEYSHAEGDSSTAIGNGSHAEGYGSNAVGHYSHAEGSNTTSSEYFSHSEGFNTTASGYASHAQGAETTASGRFSHAGGVGTSGFSYGEHAGGIYNTNYTPNSTTLFDSNDRLFVLGNGADTGRTDALTILKNGQTGIGISNFEAGTTGELLQVEGLIKSNVTISEIDSGSVKTVVTKEYLDDAVSNISGGTSGGTGGAFEVIDEGNGDGIVKTGRVAANYGNIGLDAVDLSHSDSVSTTRGATTANSYAEGLNTTASGYYGAHAEGYETKALGDRSHAEGNNTTASGYASHAEGNFTTASGDRSHAEGNNTTASGYASHAEGNFTTASGEYSHAEGDSSTAIGNGSHAEGYGSNAVGDYSHAQGVSTTSSGYFSHSEGFNTTASGYASHAQGAETTASGRFSHAQGVSTTGFSYGEHAGGIFSTNYSPNSPNGIDSGDRLFGIGNGISVGSRSDALTILKNGQTGIGISNFEAGTTGELLQVEGLMRTNVTNAQIDSGSSKTVVHKGYLESLITSGGTNFNIYTIDGVITSGTSRKVTLADSASTVSFSNSGDTNYSRFSSEDVSLVPRASLNIKLADDDFVISAIKDTTTEITSLNGLKLVINSTPTAGQVLSTSDSGGTLAWTTVAGGSDTFTTGGTYVQSASTIGFRDNQGGTYDVTNIVAPTGLEVLDEGNGDGWRLIGANTADYGNVGLEAVDLSISTGANALRGATGTRSFAEGQNTEASGLASHAEGSVTQATGNYSHAEGALTDATGDYSHAEGRLTEASGDYSHAQGDGTTASGLAAHAEGHDTVASGQTSHAEGFNTEAGDFAHAEGYETKALGDRSHASGNFTTALGSNSHASGFGSVAYSVLEYSIGSQPTDYTPNNVSSWDDGDRLFNIGIGPTSSAKTDGFTLLKGGDIGMGYDNFETGTTGERLQINGNLKVNGVTRTVGFTVANLPIGLVSIIGDRTHVTDSNATLGAGIGNVVVGGGANAAPVFWDGSSWLIG